MKDGGVWRNFGSEWTYKYLDMGFIVCLLFVSFVLENFTMPSRNTRVKQEIPADIRCLFCIHCLRHINKIYKPEEGVDYDIRCSMDGRFSVLCRFDHEDKKTCDPVRFAQFLKSVGLR